MRTSNKLINNNVPKVKYYYDLHGAWQSPVPRATSHPADTNFSSGD